MQTGNGAMDVTGRHPTHRESAERYRDPNPPPQLRHALNTH